ncbi:DUF1559 domain-containing protein [Tundrisphaera sp. TA3]|uniref:DUF1559 domain-containing protein n=1 Tax=Tundrisphaera sp. TA3 TaxID=3435775 RepID=UPI003EBE6ADB
MAMRRGVTLIEILVVLGIIGLLVGLLLPAVQAARESARRAQCANHLGQLIRATHQFEGVHGGFPPAITFGAPAVGGKVYSGYSVQVRLLPFLEQRALHDSINFAAPTGLTVESLQINHATQVFRTIEVFLCPSDPNRSPRPLAPVSYRACSGLGTSTWAAAGGRPPDHYGGVFALVDDGRFRYCSPLSAVTDGLSNTLAFSEKPIGSGAAGVYSPFRDWSEYFDINTSTPDDWVNACSRITKPVPRLEAGGTWMLFGAVFTEFYASAPPNTSIPDCGGPIYDLHSGLFSARSYHPGGVNAAMADGSVRWASSGTSQAVWRAMGTRAGGEVIPE